MWSGGEGVVNMVRGERVRETSGWSGGNGGLSGWSGCKHQDCMEHCPRDSALSRTLLTLLSAVTDGVLRDSGCAWHESVQSRTALSQFVN